MILNLDFKDQRIKRLMNFNIKKSNKKIALLSKSNKFIYKRINFGHGGITKPQYGYQLM